MTWKIKKIFSCQIHPRGEASILLNPDKTPTLDNCYPIKWTGFIGDDKIEIIQRGESALTDDDFELNLFPKKYSSYKKDVFEAIDEYQKFLD